jgi:DNA-binding NarL/FixJ family response regulator
MLRPGPFRGRRLELERAVGACRRCGVVVKGGPGSGRTRFAREVAADWSGCGGEVLWVVGTESARSFPFGALIGLAPDLDPEDFAGSARRVLDTVDGARKALLVLDDAHFLDDASAAVIHRLRLLGGSPRMLVTRLAGADAPDAVTALTKDGLLEVVELAPFPAADAGAVVADWLGGEVEHATSDYLHGLSEGNLSVLHELVDAAGSAGVLAVRGGVWSWRGEVPSSPALGTLVSSRVGHAGEQAWQVLELLSLAEPLGLQQLVALTGVEAAREAEASGLITVERRRRRADVRSAHLLYTEVVRAGLGVVRRAELLRSIDAVLATVPGRRATETLKRATIRLELGQQAPGDAVAFTEAARLARPDHVLAERFARAAIDSGAGFTAVDYLVDALLWQGRIEDARQVASEVGDDLSTEERAYFTQRWARMLWFMTGERPVEGDAPDYSDLVTPARLGTVARDAAMAAAAGRSMEAIAPALAVLANPAADDEARCWATGAAIIGLGGQGRVGDALALTPEAHACARRLTDFNYRLLLTVLDVRLRKLAGDLAGATASIEKLRHELGRAPSPNAGMVALFEGELLLAGGWARRAVPLLRDAAVALDEVDFGGLSVTAHYRLAEALVLAGDPTAAARHLQDRATSEYRTLDVFRPEQLLAKAWAHWGIGDRRGELAALAEAAERAAGQGERLVEVHVHGVGMRLGNRDSARRLLRVAPTVEGAFVASAGAHARAILAGDVAGLIAAADAYGSHGARAEAADAVAHAAQAARRAGDEREQRRLAARAQAMAAQVGGLDTPALRAVAPGTPLTRRQRDVARLAAAGMSNRDIAQRLGVAIRTVESHLDATYRRLGVSSRYELIDLFVHDP